MYSPCNKVRKLILYNQHDKDSSRGRLVQSAPASPERLDLRRSETAALRPPPPLRLAQRRHSMAARGLEARPKASRPAADLLQFRMAFVRVRQAKPAAPVLLTVQIPCLSAIARDVTKPNDLRHVLQCSFSLPSGAAVLDGRNQLFETMKRGGAGRLGSVVMPQESCAMRRPVAGPREFAGDGNAISQSRYRKNHADAPPFGRLIGCLLTPLPRTQKPRLFRAPKRPSSLAHPKNASSLVRAALDAY